MAPKLRGSMRSLVARLAILAISIALMWLGADQYGFLRYLVRVICPSCVGIG